MTANSARDESTFAVHVRRASAGNWWTVDLQGEIISQWPSEFSAIDAGRLNARRLAVPLVIHDDAGPRMEMPSPEAAD